MKRKTFKGLLLKNLVISIIAAILVIVVTGLIALKFVLLTFEKNFVNEQNRLTDYYYARYLMLQKKNPEASAEELLNNTCDYIRCELTVGFDYVPLDVILFSISSIYDQKTGELIYDASETGYLELVDNETGYGQILFCHESSLDKLRELIGNKRNFLTYMNVVVYDYYEKDGEKYFGRIDFYNDYGDGELTDSIDFAPESADEYEHVIIDNEKYTAYAPQRWGEEEGNEELAELEEYVNSGYWFHDTRDGFEYELNGMVITGMGTKVFRLPDGTSLRVFDRANVDLYKCYGKWINAFCITIPIVFLLMGALMAYLKYIKLRAIYTMEDYRRLLTDSMAHDLKSPLMAISGYAENLKENLNTDKKEHYADSIINNVQYMNDIISNILQLSKLETEKPEFNKEKFELNKLIEDNIGKYEEIISDKNLKFVIKDSVSVKGDIKLLSQALDNLISNAVKYSDEDGIIEIVSEDNFMTGVKKISISNSCSTQINIAANELWKPFVKGDNSRSNKMGTGIGLTIVKNILKLHGFKQKISYNDGRFVVEIQLN